MTEREAIVTNLSLLEDYMNTEALEFSKDERTAKKINLHLNGLIFNLSISMNQDSSLTRFNTYVLSMGVAAFVDKIKPERLKMLLEKTVENIDECILSNYPALLQSKKMHEPCYIFKDSYTKNWNQQDGTVMFNYYETEYIAKVTSQIMKFGFIGRDGAKLAREFLLLLGLRQSKILRESSKVHNNIVKITDETLRIFNRMVADIEYE